MSRFDYPTLSRQDIIAVLAESQLATVSDQDLLKPTPDFVTNLYSTVLLHVDSLQFSTFLPPLPPFRAKALILFIIFLIFFLVAREDDDQVDFSALEHLENPDVHVESFRIMNLFHKIREMLTTLDCPEPFTLRDLIKPDPERTRFFVGAMLNFSLHRSISLSHSFFFLEQL